MSLGYLGYAKLADIFLLTNSGGLNRTIDPIRSEAVWGAGWWTAAQHTNYADSQMAFEGSLAFELQGIASIWNLVKDWMIDERVTPKDLIVSPNGLVVQSFLADVADPRKGAWMNTAGFTVNAGESIKLSCDVKALIREEVAAADTVSYRSMSGRAAGVPPGTPTQVPGFGVPTGPLNPAPHNRNPFPGWAALTDINWPGSPAVIQDDPRGMFMMDADWSFNNNTQIIRGCTGDPNPAAVMQGVMAVEGNMNLFRDGSIPDPFGFPLTPFTATNSNISISFGIAPDPILTINFPFILLMSEDFTIQGQNNPVPRKFGFAGLGNGLQPPMLMAPFPP